MPRSAAKQAPHVAQTLRDGAGRGAGIVAVLANGAGHWLVLLRAIIPGQHSVAPA
jgi:hypothetical protein